MKEDPIDGPYDPELRAAGQLTSATWELELFLSGAFVFSSFQLPGIIEGLFRRLEPHVTDATAIVLFDGVLYAKAIAFTLICTFSIHLVSRAYWVALLGLSSVFPRGIRWDEMKIGPVSKEVFQAQVPSLGDVIARLDNFCSIVFSAGLLVVVMFAFSTFLAGTVAGGAYLLSVVFTHGQHMSWFLLPLAALYVGLAVGGSLIDRRFGERFAPTSRAYRTLRTLMRVAFTANFMRFTGPMMWTLATNIGRRKATVFMISALMLLIGLATVDRLAQSARLSFNSYDFFGSSAAHGVNSSYYEDMHQPGESYARLPTIQSDIVRDPYLRLFIPYIPRRDNVAIPQLCPGVRPLQSVGIQVGAGSALADSLVVPALDCLRRIHQVRLDGKLQDSLQFSFYEHPASGVKGILAYLAADSLARGRHVLSVVPVPSPDALADTAAGAKAKAGKPMLIPFWK